MWSTFQPIAPRAQVASPEAAARVRLQAGDVDELGERFRNQVLHKREEILVHEPLRAAQQQRHGIAWLRDAEAAWGSLDLGADSQSAFRGKADCKAASHSRPPVDRVSRKRQVVPIFRLPGERTTPLPHVQVRIAHIVGRAVSSKRRQDVDLEIDTAATQTDLVAVTGNFSLAGANDVVLTISDLTPAAITSGTFTFISYTGTWNGGLFTYDGSVVQDGGLLSVGSNQFTLDYDMGGNSVALIAVPEPGAALTLLSGLGMLVSLQRFRRRGTHSAA